MSLLDAIKTRRKLPSKPVMGGIAAVVVLILGFLIFHKPKQDGEPYRVQPITTGAITKSVSASGTLQALVTVEIGAQVSGQIQSVDVDFNSRVVKGQVLARLDPQTQQSKLESAQAELQASLQALNSARANLLQTVANSRVSEADYTRNKTLFDKNFVSVAALQQSDAQLQSARAAIQVSNAAVKSAQAHLQQSQASVNQARIDLGRTIIYSPITGVVVDRKINPGQTVASSLSAPVLFNIAQDLSKLELQILVDEADIGPVAVGQTVNFTVDAFPSEKFRGQITQVRKQPQTEQNVVAYVVIAQADNPDEKLLPGMTANAEIVLERKGNVLRAPTAGLRWTPADEQSASSGTRQGGGNAGGGGQRRSGGGGGGRRNNPLYVYDQIDLNPSQQSSVDRIVAEQRKTTMAAMAKMQKETSRGQTVDRTAFRKAMQDRQEAMRTKIDALLTPVQRAQAEKIRSGEGGPGLPRGQLYVLRDGKPARVGVGIGVSDGQATEVVSPRLKVGDEVVISGGPKPKTTSSSALPGVGGGRPPGGGGPGGPGGMR